MDISGTMFITVSQLMFSPFVTFSFPSLAFKKEHYVSRDLTNTCFHSPPSLPCPFPFPFSSPIGLDKNAGLTDAWPSNIMPSTVSQILRCPKHDNTLQSVT